MLELTAEVRRFIPQAMHDQLAGGGYAVYDATELVVMDPEGQKGRTLRIYHDHEIPATSPWREVGRRLRLRLPESMLAPGVQVFSGAVQGLTPL